MKLIKEIIYQEHQSEKRVGQVDDLVYSIRRKDGEFSLFFEVRETEAFVIFANLYAFERTDEERAGNEERVVQVETALLNKEDMTVYFMQDNLGLDSYDRLKAYPYWESEDLVSLGVVKFTDADFLGPQWNE